MPKPKPTFIPDPRFYTAYQVATLLGKSGTWFKTRRANLERRGFPKRNELIDGWDAKAIEHYCDLKSGIRQPVSNVETEEDILERLNR